VTDPSYPAPGYPANAARSRPTIVTVASSLLYLVAAIQVINAIATFATAGPIQDAVRDAYDGTASEGAEGVVAGIFIIGGVLNLVIGLGFAVLGYFDGRGKNVSRIITWVVGGISLCCLGAGLGSNAFVGSMNAGSGNGGPSQDELQQRINDALPGWYSPVTTTLTVIGLIVILAVVILLALPASNEFFRKPAAGGWDPNVPYPQYPGSPYPGQPQGGYGPAAYPAYPGPQGQPGQPAPGLPPYPGQPQSGPPQSGQPYPGQPYPGQPYPGQPYPGQPQYPGQQPPAASDPYAAPSDPYAAPPSGPASDPYAPPPSGGDQRPSEDDQPPAGGQQPPKPPTDPV
jgi:hypothetical protein